MYLHVHFAAIAAWLLLAIAGLLWIMACALTAGRMEKEGITFWKGLLVSLLLSPLAGLIVVFAARMIRPGRSLAHDVSRS
jgi:Na+-driven multidrug efflux pump